MHPVLLGPLSVSQQCLVMTMERTIFSLFFLQLCVSVLFHHCNSDDNDNSDDDKEWSHCCWHEEMETERRRKVTDTHGKHYPATHIYFKKEILFHVCARMWWVTLWHDQMWWRWLLSHASHRKSYTNILPAHKSGRCISSLAREALLAIVVCTNDDICHRRLFHFHSVWMQCK